MAVSKFVAEVNTWEQARAFLDGRKSRKLAHNTYVVDTSAGMPESLKTFAIKYHDTHIVKFFSHGSVVFTDGGYDTITTRGRLNNVMHHYGYGLARHKGETWLVDRDHKRLRVWDTREWFHRAHSYGGSLCLPE